MREWKAEDIAKQVAEKMPEVNRGIIRSRKERVIRRRPRDPEERKILDFLCKREWEKALAEGKVKIINKREWYCEFD